MKLFRQLTGWASVLIAALAIHAAAAPTQWDKPASALAEQIAAILGPAQASLTLRNLSTIPAADLPAIQISIEQALKAHSILVSTAETANTLRITLSQNDRERLWVAEIVQGNQARVVMVPASLPANQADSSTEQIELKKEHIFLASDPGQPSSPVLGALETSTGLLLLYPDRLDLLELQGNFWHTVRHIPILVPRSLPRDPRGVLMSTRDATGITAFLPGVRCDGAYTRPVEPSAHPGDGWAFTCHAGDDPWTILAADTPDGPTAFRAFYNAARNYFTGLVSPGRGVDLPPFYAAAYLDRTSGPAVLINSVDGKIRLLESNSLKAISGVRDWGSEFATLPTSCAGTVVLATASGEASQDSLRAYSLPAVDASPASAPLAMNGIITALWTAPDGNRVYAIVRNGANQYEVDRVTALCN